MKKTDKTYVNVTDILF